MHPNFHVGDRDRSSHTYTPYKEDRTRRRRDRTPAQSATVQLRPAGLAEEPDAVYVTGGFDVDAEPAIEFRAILNRHPQHQVRGLLELLVREAALDEITTEAVANLKRDVGELFLLATCFSPFDVYGNARRRLRGRRDRGARLRSLQPRIR